MTADLIKALQSISPWYRNPDRERPSYFPVGLTLDEIEKKASVLPFQLPKEVYEIYQWCNGSKNPEAPDDEYDLTVRSQYPYPYEYEYNIIIAGEAQFFDLDKAIDLWLSNNKGRVREASPIFTFPIMSHENGLIVIAGNDKQHSTSPVWDIDSITDELRTPKYPNIANMMTAVAEVEKKEREFFAASDELGYFDHKAFDYACEDIRKIYGN